MTLNRDEAFKALQEARVGTLSVIDFETGYPMGSLVNVATTPEHKPLLLLSSLSRHHKCLSQDNRASLLVSLPLPAADPLSGFRAGFQGPMEKLDHSDALRSAYVARHDYAQAYIEFGDFSFWCMTPHLIHVVGGFGRIETIRL